MNITKDQALNVKYWIQDWRMDNPYKRRKNKSFNAKFEKDFLKFLKSENFTPEQIEFFLNK